MNINEAKELKRKAAADITQTAETGSLHISRRRIRRAWAAATPEEKEAAIIKAASALKDAGLWQS